LLAHAERFELSKPVEKWDGVFHATEARKICPQFGSAKDLGSEDCLYLNVLTPAIEENGNRSVMVWLHGGAYEQGNSNFNIQSLVARGDIVLVSLQYRLGPLGFLYGGSTHAPGNQALYDLILGLKWVQDNIAHFGGSPHQVTLFGHSAGSMATGALVLSPLAKG